MIRQEAMQANLEAVQGRIAEAARQAGRDPAGIRLVLVTKGHPVDLVDEMLELGVQQVGESYAEEGIEKKQALDYYQDVEWHMIGHVQSRKAKLVAPHFDMLHSLGRLKLARKLNDVLGELGRRMPVLLQVNVSGEGSKHGFPAPEVDSWQDWRADLEAILAMPTLELRGLMSMAPFVEDPAQARPYFERTRRMRDALAAEYPDEDWSQLSMGMSHDFEAAILEGATLVRIGSAILGPRPSN